MLTFSLIFAMLTAAHADPICGAEALWVLPDAFAVELALERTGLARRETSALYGAVVDGSRVDGSRARISAIGWLRLDGVEVVSPLETKALDERRQCAKVRGHDPVPGGRQIVGFHGRPDGAEAPPLEGPPTLVLGSNADGEYALVQLLPGDVLQVTDATRPGQEPWEHIELTRDNQRLTLVRRGRGAQVCHEPDTEMRAGWLPD